MYKNVLDIRILVWVKLIFYIYLKIDINELVYIVIILLQTGVRLSSKKYNSVLGISKIQNIDTWIVNFKT